MRPERNDTKTKSKAMISPERKSAKQSRQSTSPRFRLWSMRRSARRRRFCSSETRPSRLCGCAAGPGRGTSLPKRSRARSSSVGRQTASFYHSARCADGGVYQTPDPRGHCRSGPHQRAAASRCRFVGASRCPPDGGRRNTAPSCRPPCSRTAPPSRAAHPRTIATGHGLRRLQPLTRAKAIRARGNQLRLASSSIGCGAWERRPDAPHSRPRCHEASPGVGFPPATVRPASGMPAVRRTSGAIA